MARNRRQRDRQYHLTRRSLIKWSAGMGAMLGLPRWKVFEALEVAGGSALAQDASCHPTNRSVHIVAGSGGFAWFQLLWPHNDVAAAGNANFAFHAPGEQTMAQGTDKPLTLGPEAPWKDVNGRFQVTALMAGSNETHTNSPDSASAIDGGVSMMAACASMQTTNPTLVPVIAISDTPFGDAPGAPRVSRVGNPIDVVGLFDSTTSREGGLLANAADAELYDAHYKAFLQLNAAAGTPALVSPYATGKTASSFLGTNLRSQLEPTNDDLARYGIDGGTPTRLRQIAEALIIAVKAFSMGLTSSVILPAMRDDPHGAFNDMNNLRQTVGTLGQTLDAFRADLAAVDDPDCAGKKLADTTVMTIHGDTPKTPLNRNGWPDGTPNNSNWMYVLGAGYLKTGWFGGIRRDGSVLGWNPQTGEDANVASAATANAASAAVAYAVAKGDMRRVGEFYRGDALTGIVNAVNM